MLTCKVELLSIRNEVGFMLTWIVNCCQYREDDETGYGPTQQDCGLLSTG